jgi:DNA mismatch repair protein MutS
VEPGPTRAPDPVISILFLRPEDRAATVGAPAPDCFGDLNLDQVVAAITRGREAYALDAYLHAPLTDLDAVAYRHEVFRDLEPASIRERIVAFSARMRTVRDLLAQRLEHRYQQESWFFEAAAAYAVGVSELAAALEGIEAGSRGLRAFIAHLTTYVRSPRFRDMVAEASTVRDGLAAIRYNLRIQGDRVTVGPADPGPDLTAEIEAAFARFRRGTVRDYLATFPLDPDLSHVGILDRIARLNPDAFAALDAFCDRHRDFVDPTIETFEREVQFYLAYLELLDGVRKAGLPFCYPQLSEGGAGLRLRELFDLALADKIAGRGGQVVRNDVELEGAERVIVVTGPNQGGKTTFARAVGQVHYLAGLGCPVPGTEARVGLVDGLYSHFGREEQLSDLRGRLEDDLLRMHAILERATSRSVIILNEVFTSTTLHDATHLSAEVLRRLEGRDLVCVWVTFVDEIADMGDKTVSLVAGVLPDDPSVRTFKLTRRPPDGRAYASALATKYGVSYERLRERLSP